MPCGPAFYIVSLTKFSFIAMLSAFLYSVRVIDQITIIFQCHVVLPIYAYAKNHVVLPFTQSLTKINSYS